MSDTLEVFGTEYSNVTGIKATDNNGDIQTYIKPEGTINITTKGLTDVTAYRTANVDTGTSVPDGGSTGQALTKSSNDDGDVGWSTIDKTYVGLGNVDNTSDANKPISTATQTALNGKLSTSLKGANSGLAELDANGKVPTSQLPSFVDDVLEYSAQSSFPATGETGKIYIAQDTNKTYRWSGTAYVEISSSLALGTTSSTAYRGDYGNTAYTHATDSSRSTTAQASGLYKIATTAEGHVASTTAVIKSDITDLGIPAQDTTDLESMTGTLPIANGGTGKTTAAAAANALIGGLSAWTATPTDDTYFIRQDTGGGLSFGRAKFSTLWTYIKNKISSVLGLTSSTYGGSAAQVNGHTVAVDVPSGAVFTDTVYTHPTTSGNKHIPSGGSSGQILKYSADGTAQWANETAELPSGGSTGNVLRKTSNGYEWAGYAVPTGGSSGYVLAKSSNTNGALTWKSVWSMPSYSYYRDTQVLKQYYYNSAGWEALRRNYNVEKWEDSPSGKQYWHMSEGYSEYYDDLSLYNEYKNGTPCFLTFVEIDYDDISGEENVTETVYQVDYVSDQIEDPAYANNNGYTAYGIYSSEFTYYIHMSRLLSDNTIEKKIFQAIYESENNWVWLLFDVTSSFPSASALPSGGSTGQVLIKNSNTDGDATWTSGGSNGQVLMKNSNGASWTSIRQVPGDDGQAGAFLANFGGTYPIWDYDKYEITIETDSNTNEYMCTLYEISDLWNNYINGRKIFIEYMDNNGDYDSNYYVLTGLHENDLPNDEHSYLIHFERLKSDGTFDKRQMLITFDANDGLWHGAEQAVPAGSSAQSAVGVSF